MEREEVRITDNNDFGGNYKFGDNYKLNFKSEDNEYQLYVWLSDCNITCGNNCEIICGSNCNITCGNDCEITCGSYCNINSQNNCEIKCASFSNIICGNNSIVNFGLVSYVKAGEGSQLKVYKNLLKTITKGEEFIWWNSDVNSLINTFEDVDWRNKYPDKWNELYPFVQNELNSATLF